MVSRSQHFRDLNNFYKTSSKLHISQFSSIRVPIKPMSQFSASYNDIELPFRISGRLITSGSYREGAFSKVILHPEALKSTLSEWVGINIYTSHQVYEKIRNGEPVSANEVVGKIVSTSWNEKDGGIDFVADVMDRQIAYKMAHGLIQFISVGFARQIVSRDDDYYFAGIEPKEASLVFDPRDANASFKPVN